MQSTTNMTSSGDTLQELKEEDDLQSAIDFENALPGTTNGSHADSNRRCISVGPVRQSNLKLDNLEPGGIVESSVNKPSASNPILVKTGHAIGNKEDGASKTIEKTPGPEKNLSSVSQPLPFKKNNALRKEKIAASYSTVSTQGPAADILEVAGRDSPAKRSKLLFGVAAFGACSNCEKVRRQMSYEIAMVRKKARLERETLKRQINELEDQQNKGNAEFAQVMCKTFKDERDELKKTNSLLTSKLKKIQQVLLM